jgi:hypothetical protein
VATDTEMHEHEQFEVNVPSDEPDPVLGDVLKKDHKLFWLVASVVTYGFFVYFANPPGIWVFLVFVAIVGLNVGLFWIPFFDARRTSLSAWLFRSGPHYARQLFNMNNARSEDYKRGHVAVHHPVDETGKEPIPYPELERAWVRRKITLPPGVGKTLFYPTDVGQAHPMGWIRHPGSRSWVISARTFWYPWDPASVAAQQSRLAALGRLLDMFADTGNGLSRIVLQDRTIIGEWFRKAQDLDPFLQDRRSNSSDMPPDSDAYMTELTDEMANLAVSHLSTITVAIKRGRKPGAKVPEAALRDYEAFCRGATGKSVGVQQLWPFSHNQAVFELLLALDPELVSQNWELLLEWVAQKKLIDPGIINPPTWDEGLKSTRIGETWHDGWTVENYGHDGKMPPDSMWRLVGQPIPKTVTTVIEMVPMSLAKFLTNRSTAAVRTRNKEKESLGRDNEFHKEELERRQEHARALARKRGMQSFSHTFVDFTGPSAMEARANAVAVAATVRHPDLHHNSGILLRPLTGAQRDNIGAVTPLGLGLSSGTFSKTATSVLQSSSSAE